MSRRVARALRQTIARAAGIPGPRPWIDGAVATRAVELGLASATYAALKHGDAYDAIEMRHRELLRTAADREAALVLASEEEARRVAKRLSEAGIAVVALKGLAANARIHRPRGWCRAPGDLDLLVPDAEAVRATRLFLDDPDYEAHGPWTHDGFYDEHHHTRPFARRGRHVLPIELHRRVSGVTTGNIVIDHAALWERSLPFDELAPGMRRLDDVDHALTTIIHIDRDDAYGGRARQLFDLAMSRDLLETRREDLLARAASWNARATVARGLDLLDAFLLHPPSGRGLRSWAWQTVAIDLAVGDGTNDALPVWYRQGVFRAISHARGWRQVLARIALPLRRRLEGRVPTA